MQYFFFQSYYINISVILVSIFLIVHIILYADMARKEERNNNFYELAIGVDIDGVINKMRYQFSEYLKKTTGKDLNPEQITKIPVRKMNIGIGRQDEKTVFCNSDYWEKMPPIEDACEYIKEIKNSLGMKVHIFTWRPWDKIENSQSNKRKKKLFNITKKYYRKNKINKITKQWLKNNNISFDKISIEKGDLFFPAKRKIAKYKNRYYICKKKRIMFFVEDNLENALKLSEICRYVFLYNQPYNQCESLPQSIIRVHSWEQIYDKVKELI